MALQNKNSKKTDANDLAILLKEGRFAEAERLIDAIVHAPMTAPERARAHISLMGVYMQAINAINVRYKEALEDSIGLFEKANVENAKSDKLVKLAKTRAELA